jgi:hypothetical protein
MERWDLVALGASLLATVVALLWGRTQLTQLRGQLRRREKQLRESEEELLQLRQAFSRLATELQVAEQPEARSLVFPLEPDELDTLGFRTLVDPELRLSLPDFLQAAQRRVRARASGVGSTGSLYLSTTDTALAEQFFTAFVEALASLDVEVVPDGPPVVGSWFQRIRLATGRAAHSPAVTDGVEKGVHAAETMALRGPMSQVNVNQADAIAKLAEAAAKVDEFVAITDGVVLVKATAPDGRTKTVARTLTVRQIRDLERRSELAAAPAAMLRYLLEPQGPESGTALPERSDD